MGAHLLEVACESLGRETIMYVCKYAGEQSFAAAGRLRFQFVSYRALRSALRSGYGENICREIRCEAGEALLLGGRAGQRP